jgi:hypothetical protein
MNFENLCLFIFTAIVISFVTSGMACFILSKFMWKTHQWNRKTPWAMTASVLAVFSWGVIFYLWADATWIPSVVLCIALGVTISLFLSILFGKWSLDSDALANNEEQRAYLQNMSL